jgi:CRISPR/Cas system CSM-associated protein Csm3 (group 7 of RAMP superfamily)
MKVSGKIIAESPIFRGNGRKTLFTRDLDGTHRLISLPGEIGGTAQALMDAFMGASRNGRNVGLLNRMWQRLFDEAMPNDLIKSIQCQLALESYSQDKFFDLRMGLKLNEDRWAAESNANYKMETVFRNAVFNFVAQIDDSVWRRGDNAAKLTVIFEELQAGNFWFGAGKSKGLGRCRLTLDEALPAPAKAPNLHPNANHLRISLQFDATNPVLVGWNWGKVDPEKPAFAAVDGRVLVEAMRSLSPTTRRSLALVLGGPLLSPEDWKKRLATVLPQTVAVWVRRQSAVEGVMLTLSADALKRLGKGKYALSDKVLDSVRPLVDQPFPGEKAAESALAAALGSKANMTNRILKEMTTSTASGYQLNSAVWEEVAGDVGMTAAQAAQVAAVLADESQLRVLFAQNARNILPTLYDQVDQQIRLLESDAWIDTEIAVREEHLKIKEMLLRGDIGERQYGDYGQVPPGVSAGAWRDFLNEHRRVQYSHITNPPNLRKSITNDRNFIAFLTGHRARARQELAQPSNVDFRSGGPFNREVSRKYGKPYDTIFMRMLTWSPSTSQAGAWEVYIPGGTIKGAFRKRATQVLRTLWGEGRRVDEVIDFLFGKQGQRGAILFSDAYLSDPIQPDHVWCSMDGVRMDPRTARPIEAAKHDYLFGYGEQLIFQLQLDLHDLIESDREALAVFLHLLRDFQTGEIPIGGEKTVGLGWVQAHVREIDWRSSTNQKMTRLLFGDPLPAEVTSEGGWQRLHLQGDAAASALQQIAILNATQNVDRAPQSSLGFVSHRAFGGYCGVLAVEAEVLSPLHVRESGEPSHRAELAGLPVNGWDSFSLAPPDAGLRPEKRLYALPSRSLKGMLRHLYAIASDSRGESKDIASLLPADSLFGWVGASANQAIMGRLAIGIAQFDPASTFAWFRVPYPYSGWLYANGEWQPRKGNGVSQFQIAKEWRLFPHAPLAPLVQQMDSFQPDVAQASYLRAILPGGRARFTIRFWNLDEVELQRLIWCVGLEPGLAHKLGHHRHLGFGALRLSILPESFLTDWTTRYSNRGLNAGQLALDLNRWQDYKVIAHRADLLHALDAHAI